MRLMCKAILVVSVVLCAYRAGAAQQAAEETRKPRVVNVYNFIRNTDYRMKDSERRLYEATRRQVDLFAKHRLPVTWALQYDALINPKYQKLLKENIGPGDEIGAWWELPRPLVEKAGIKWRGNHDWVSTANIAFSPGYSPSDRIKLVDTYMAEFKKVFGKYPRSVGSWYIDEVTLAHMVDQYGIVASCNCKDQIGTDGYTLWGGYWNQAYYPSQVNAYMPAQSKAGQIDVPIFRMLGSDPIYQYGRASSLTSLEPVYGHAGGSPDWVKWFLKSLTQQPCLAFGYTQAGQENSFGWNAMSRGLEMQAEYLAGLAAAGEIRVETLADSGEWFRKKYPVTPATAFVCLDDWRKEGRKSVWYNSRFYRLNLYWDKEGITIRDIHRFDETRKSVNHSAALAESTMSFGTLPIVDGVEPFSKDHVGAFPRCELEPGKSVRLAIDGTPVVTEVNDTDLLVTQPLADEGELIIRCEENQVTLAVARGTGKSPVWSLDFQGQRKPQSISESVATYESRLGKFQVSLAQDSGSFQTQENGQLKIRSNENGSITLVLGKNSK